MADFGGRYRRVSRLGSGGMGEVWLAHDEMLAGRLVAIKIMHAHMLVSAEDVARFQREMNLTAKMQHPNILTVFTTGTDNGIPFMVTEYLEGRDLGKGLPDGSIGHIANIGRKVCDALAYAHDMGVVHRDIKPSNLFLCSTGVMKVTDFGIAKAVNRTQLSASGILIGTFAYMAPEQWLGGPASFSNDIWATGCTLYQLVSGRLPRSYSTPGEYAAAAARAEPILSLERTANTPKWLADVIMAMLEPEAGNRPSAAECARMLSSSPADAFPVHQGPLRTHASGSVTRTSVSSTMTEQRQSHRLAKAQSDSIRIDQNRNFAAELLSQRLRLVNLASVIGTLPGAIGVYLACYAAIHFILHVGTGSDRIASGIMTTIICGPLLVIHLRR